MFEEQDIIVNKAVLKALGAETRVAILKSLEKRQKTPSELSVELKLSVPTILEHLSHLEAAKLIERHDDGHKWKYYALTKTGKQIKSGTPLRVLILLAIGILFLFTSFMYVPTPYDAQPQTQSVSESKMANEKIATITPEAIPQENGYDGALAQDGASLEPSLLPLDGAFSLNTLFASIGCLVLGIGIGYWLKK